MKTNRYIVFTALVLCFINKINAQVLLPTTESAFEKQHNFNPEVIKNKNIRKIIFEIVDKKDFETVVDKNLSETYEFDTNGLLTRYYYTTIIKSVEREIKTGATYKGRRKISNGSSYTINDYIYDTISTSYFYDINNRLKLKRYHDGANYYESRYYRYNQTNFLTKELRFKETNNSKDKSVFILGNQVLLSEDSFQYQKFSTGQLKCTFLNNENRSYKEQITNYDSLGNKKMIFENYTAASWIVQEQNFTYKNNRMQTAEFKGNANNTITLKRIYEFDANKELLTEKQFKNDVQLKEVSYVSDSNNNLLNSFIIRDAINKNMRIVKLKYDFGSITKSKN